MARPVHVSRLVPHAANIRESLGDLTGLTDSIRSQGILQPLVAEPRPDGKYTVLAGHRRLAAARRAGLEMVPVTIRRATSDRARAIEVMLVENCQRLDLGPVERAEAMGELRERGYTMTAIARAIGLTVSSVSTTLALLELDETSRERVRSGAVKSGDALAAVRRTRARRGGRTGRPVHAEPPWFTGKHPLAAAARGLCHHTARHIYGGVACGACWEQAIREDATQPPDEADEPEAVERLSPRAERMELIAGLRLADGPVPQPGQVTARKAAERAGVSVRTIERYKRDLAATS